MPSRSLTAAAVDRIKPPSKGQVEHFDKGFPGLALRVSYGGGKSWVFFYRAGGKLRRLTLGTYPALALAEAREAWREARKAVQCGRDPALDRKREKPAIQFRAVAEEWLRRDQGKNRSVYAVRRALEKNVLSIWGERSVDEIGRREIRDLIDGIVDRGSPVMARRAHAYLHRLFRWAVGRDIIASNPMADLPKPGLETKRDRVLSDEELAAVWNAAKQVGWPFDRAIHLLILTGARRGEIGDLRWSEVDANLIRLSGARTKNGEPHDIPLSSAARKVLEGNPRIAGSDFVFRGIKSWPRAKASLDLIASIPPWRIHDLRRTFATGLQKLGVGLQVVEALLGHIAGSRAGIVSIYQRHSYADEKRVALEAWGRSVTAITDEQVRSLLNTELSAGDQEAQDKARKSFNRAISEGGASWSAYLAALAESRSVVVPMRGMG
jgi:integrase